MKKQNNKYMTRKITAILLVAGLLVGDLPISTYAAAISQNETEQVIDTGTIEVDETGETSETSETSETVGVSDNQGVSINEATSTQISEKEILETVQEVGIAEENFPVDSIEEEVGSISSKSQDAGITTFAPSVEEISTGESLPANYDSRNDNGTSYVTPIRNQLSSVLCWAFSAAAAAEASAIKKRLITSSDYLSPEHIGYFWKNHVDDELGGNSGASVTDHASNYIQTYGSTLNTTFQLANWVGLASETEVPFTGSVQNHSDSKAYDNEVVMKNSYWLNITDQEYVKKAIKDHGAVTANMVLYSNRINDHHAYYYNGTGAVSHAVTLVGWDDNYPKENFTSFCGSTSDTVSNLNGLEAPGDGAYIVRDSYGEEGNRENGYFYMSYYDSVLGYTGQKAIAIDCSSTEGYDHNYQYDGGYGLKTMTFSNEIYGGNIFTAKANMEGDERLKAVSFATPSVLGDYSIQIYTDVTSTTNPTAGTPAFTTPQKGSFTYAGIHTIDLTTPVELEEGEKFSVVIKLSKSGEIAFMTDESYVGYSGSTYIRTYNTSVVQGRSFYSGNGTSWTDGKNRVVGSTERPCNIRIKAYTEDVNSLNQKTIDDSMVASIPAETYTGGQITPDPVIYYGDKRLVKDTDYQVTYEENTNVGSKSGKLTIIGKGSYQTEAPIVKYFAINKKSVLAEDMYVAGLEDTVYSGVAQTPIVLHDSAGAVNESNYTVTYRKNREAGTATAVIKGINNLIGTKTVTFVIDKKSLNASSVEFQSIPGQSYQADYVKPVPVIKDGLRNGAVLVCNKDFTVTYRNNINPGEATCTVSGKGNYTGSKTLTFPIGAVDISKLALSTIGNQVYAGGFAIRPTVVLTDGKTTLKDGAHFTATYSNNVNVGTATITLQGKAGTIYAGSERIIHFEIVKANIATNCTMTNFGDKTYVVGKEQTQEVVLTQSNGKVLTKGTDYVIAYSNNKDPGTATMTITAMGNNYTGTIVKNFTIVAGKISLNDFSDSNIVISGFSYGRQYLKTSTYYEKNKVIDTNVYPKISIYYKGIKLENGVDYNLSYRNNDKVGTAKVIITAISTGTYYGTREEEFYIIGKPIFPLGLDTGFKINTFKDVEYTGNETKQTVKLLEQYTYNNLEENKTYYRTLKQGKDYIVTYESNINVGTAKLTITGINNYSGSGTYSYQITPKNIQAYTATKIKNQAYTGSEINPTVYLKNGRTFLQEGTDYTLSMTNNKEVGTATVIFTACEDSLNFTGSKTIHFNIVKGNLKNLQTGDISGVTDQVYDGTPKTPVPVITYQGVLLTDKDYSISYAKNTAIGTARIQIRAKTQKQGGSGNFTGSKNITFKITGQPISVDTNYAGGDVVYTGKALKPALDSIVTTDGQTLYNKKDYKINYKSYKNVGKGYLYLTGLGSYKNSQAVITYNVIPYEVNGGYQISGLKAQKLGTKSAVRPSFRVVVNRRRLKAGVDYTVTYYNNTKAGNATVKITFIGNYSGTGFAGFLVK